MCLDGDNMKMKLNKAGCKDVKNPDLTQGKSKWDFW